MPYDVFAKDLEMLGVEADIVNWREQREKSKMESLMRRRR